jgi:2-isopropylmalate synthase
VAIPVRLAEYSVQSVTAGIDALGEVSVRVESSYGTYIGRGAHTDIIVASARAYLNALNKVIAARREHEAGRGRSSRAGSDWKPESQALQPVEAVPV